MMIAKCESAFAVANVEHKHLFAAWGGGVDGAADLNICTFVYLRQPFLTNHVHLRVILEYFWAQFILLVIGHATLNAKVKHTEA